MAWEEIPSRWQGKQVRTAADIALEMNGSGAAFIYHSAKIENDNITCHDTREIYGHGGALPAGGAELPIPFRRKSLPRLSPSDSGGHAAGSPGGDQKGGVNQIRAPEL